MSKAAVEQSTVHRPPSTVHCQTREAVSTCRARRWSSLLPVGLATALVVGAGLGALRVSAESAPGAEPEALPAAAVAARTPAPKPAVARPVQPISARPRTPIRVATLSNGLRLLCRPNNSSEIVSIVCLVRAGLPDEKEDQAGLAALTAESLLKGTTTHLGSNWDAAIARAGGSLRSAPDFDFTEIDLVTSRDSFADAVKLIGDVVAHPRLSSEDVNDARTALKQRVTADNERFFQASYQTLASALYPHTPYGRAINGYAQTLDRLGAADVKRFWKDNYVQNRMCVSIVGDVDAEKALGLAQKAFADVPLKPDAVTPTPPGESLGRPRVELLRRSGPMAQLMVGFLAPPATRATYPVYALLDALVGGGKRARLFANIREKQSLGYALGSQYQPLAFQSHLYGYVVTPQFRKNPKTEQAESVMEDVKQALLRQYAGLAEAGPTDQEMARAKAYLIGRNALRQERTRDQAYSLAWNEAMGLGRDFDQQFPVLVQAVTKEQIQAAAKSSLGNYALVMTVPDPS